MKKLTFLTMLFICSSLMLLTGCGSAPEGARVGKPAPDFTLVDRQGKSWTLSELKGQVVFVNFWATWCAPCREEMPSMQRLYEKMPKDTFKMLAILNNDDPALADSFATKLGLTMPILDDQANNVGVKYGITGIPETFIINKNGIIVRKFLGPAQWSLPRFTRMLKVFMDK
ncbi:MAG: TlpA family protein disulfide reductase [Desulfocapsa sp.]|nr:TlpA family protein disulfide reductase [Desulfocapsa sp.]